MVTTRYSDQQGWSKSRQYSYQVQPIDKRTLKTLETYRRQDDVFGNELQFLLSGVLPIQESHLK